MIACSGFAILKARSERLKLSAKVVRCVLRANCCSAEDLEKVHVMTERDEKGAKMKVFVRVKALRGG